MGKYKNFFGSNFSWRKFVPVLKCSILQYYRVITRSIARFIVIDIPPLTLTVKMHSGNFSLFTFPNTWWVVLSVASVTFFWNFLLMICNLPLIFSNFLFYKTFASIYYSFMKLTTFEWFDSFLIIVIILLWKLQKLEMFYLFHEIIIISCCYSVSWWCNLYTIFLKATGL